MIGESGGWSPGALYSPEPMGARGSKLMPEQRLALAVLESAVAAFQRHAGSATPAFIEARDWLFSDDARWPFAFVNVCAALALEPIHLRRGLGVWLHKNGIEADRPAAATARRRTRVRSRMEMPIAVEPKTS